MEQVFQLRLEEVVYACIHRDIRHCEVIRARLVGRGKIGEHLRIVDQQQRLVTDLTREI